VTAGSHLCDNQYKGHQVAFKTWQTVLREILYRKRAGNHTTQLQHGAQETKHAQYCHGCMLTNIPVLIHTRKWKCRIPGDVWWCWLRLLCALVVALVEVVGAFLMLLLSASTGVVGRGSCGVAWCGMEQAYLTPRCGVGRAYPTPLRGTGLPHPTVWSGTGLPHPIVCRSKWTPLYPNPW
jgi:hypothetical protein